MERKDAIDAMLERRGIMDPEAYLSELDESANIGESGDPEVPVRGSILLMLNEVSTRAKVSLGLSKLKHL